VDISGHAVVGWATDVDVSGSVDPFDTPQLGDWLNNRAPEFDVIACWKLDRLRRKAIRLNHLFGWCLEHDKSVVSCSESIDLSTPVGRLIANVIGFLAEGELEAIRERTRSSKAKLRELGRWSRWKGALRVYRDPAWRWVVAPSRPRCRSCGEAHRRRVPVWPSVGAYRRRPEPRRDNAVRGLPGSIFRRFLACLIYPKQVAV